jgi:hypothetical protein
MRDSKLIIVATLVALTNTGFAQTEPPSVPGTRHGA